MSRKLNNLHDTPCDSHSEEKVLRWRNGEQCGKIFGKSPRHTFDIFNALVTDFARVEIQAFQIGQACIIIELVMLTLLSRFVDSFPNVAAKSHVLKCWGLKS